MDKSWSVLWWWWWCVPLSVMLAPCTVTCHSSLISVLMETYFKSLCVTVGLCLWIRSTSLYFLVLLSVIENITLSTLFNNLQFLMYNCTTWSTTALLLVNMNHFHHVICILVACGQCTKDTRNNKKYIYTLSHTVHFESYVKSSSKFVTITISW